MKIFKKIAVIALALLMLAACGSKTAANGAQIRDGKSLSELMTEVDSAYEKEYGYGTVAMPMEIDKDYLADMCGIDKDDVADCAGWIALSMTNSDVFFAVEAKDGKIDTVAEKLSDRVKALQAQYEFYPVNGSYDRALAGKVVVKGNYAFIIVVGDEGTFDEQVSFVVNEVEGMFA